MASKIEAWAIIDQVEFWKVVDHLEKANGPVPVKELLKNFGITNEDLESYVEFLEKLDYKIALISKNGDDFILDMEIDDHYAYTGSKLQLQMFALGVEGYAFLGHSYVANELEDVAVDGAYVYLAGEDGFQIVQGPPYNPVFLPALLAQ